MKKLWVIHCAVLQIVHDVRVTEPALSPSFFPSHPLFGHALNGLMYLRDHLKNPLEIHWKENGKHSCLQMLMFAGDFSHRHAYSSGLKKKWFWNNPAGKTNQNALSRHSLLRWPVKCIKYTVLDAQILTKIQICLCIIKFFLYLNVL